MSLENIEALRIEIVISMSKTLFHNVKKYDSHFIMQILSKFNLKINFVPNGLQNWKSI